MDPTRLDELAAWIDAYADATDDTLADLIAAILAIYEDVDPYSAREVAAAAAQAADQSNVSTLLSAGIAAQYLASILGIIGDTSVPVPTPQLIPIRGGVDMGKVYERPAKLVRRLVAKGVPFDEAWRRANAYIAALADGDVRLAQRQALDFTMAGLGVTGYRRILRPELSRDGSCGLCIAASDRVYKVGTLMPIHARCKCTVMPIVGGVDPGASLNNLSLGDLYDAAGSTSGKDLKKVRYSVNEHGEWGPVLTREGDAFTGPDDLLPAA